MRLATIIRDLKDTDAPFARKALAALPVRNEARERMRKAMGLPPLVAKIESAYATTYGAVNERGIEIK